jgi:hypothetical protein
VKCQPVSNRAEATRLRKRQYRQCERDRAHEVPQEYGVREYRYTVVNDRPVLVDPRTRRIVEVVE